MRGKCNKLRTIFPSSPMLLPVSLFVILLLLLLVLLAPPPASVAAPIAIDVHINASASATFVRSSSFAVDDVDTHHNSVTTAIAMATSPRS